MRDYYHPNIYKNQNTRPCLTGYPVHLHSLQGKAISLAEACFGVGTMFGPSLGGFLYEAGGFSLPFWVSGSYVLLLLLLLLSLLLLSLLEEKSQC